MQAVKVKSIASHIPQNVITNEDLSKFVDTSDEWITTRTGIKERRISDGDDVVELGYKASIKALKEAGINPEELELILVSTATPKNFFPSDACLIQAELGASNAVAFNISAACTGAIFGLETAYRFMQSGAYKKALVVCSEALSKAVDWEDRSTCVLFGDGAAAFVLSLEEGTGGVLSVKIKSDGTKGDAIKCRARDMKNILVDNEKEKDYISMDGREVFKFATKAMADSIQEVLDQHELTSDDIKYIVPHQANTRIIDYAIKKLKIEPNKFYVNIDRFGNTSSASIGIALSEMKENNLIKEGDKIILVGFGAGLTWGAALIEM